MRITEHSVRRRLATSAILLALVVLGLYGLWRLPVDFLPDLTYPVVKVNIRWPGATPDEIDKDIADPIERFMATVDNLDSLESTARESAYNLDVNFEYGTDVNVAFQDVLAALARAEPHLPADIEPPLVFKADPSQLPVMQLAVSSERWGPVQVRDWTENWLQDRVLATRGVAGVQIIGGLEREIRVLLDPAAVERHDLSLETVLNRLRQENVERAAGRVSDGRREVIARTTGHYASIEEIESVLVARRGQEQVHVRDIAQVVDGHEEQRLITRFNGRECVVLSVLKEAEANTVEVARALEERLREMEPAFPEGVRLDYVENQAQYVEESLSGVRNAAIGAAVLLVILVYLFLGSLRQVLVMAVALPLTLVLNFGLMELAGFSLNIFSLGGLVVAIGVVLDNSIVVLENITRRRHEEPDGDLAAQSVEATAEVGPAVVAATLSFLALFVPFLIVPGLTTLLFRELILVVAGIVVISLTVAVTVTPMLAATLLGRRGQSGEAGGAGRFERLFARLTDAYGRSLHGALRARRLVLVLFLAVLGLGALVLGRVGGEFLPLMDDGRILVNVNLPTGASLQETEHIVARIEREIADDPLVENVFFLAGGRIRGFDTSEQANRGELNLQLVPKARRDVSTAEYARQLRRRLMQVSPPGVTAMARPMGVRGLRGLRGSDIEVGIRGPDTDTLAELARRAVSSMQELDDLANVSVLLDLTRPEYQVRIDRTRASELGITAAEVADSLRTLVTGTVPTRYRDGVHYYDIRLIVPEGRISDRQDLENLPLSSNPGGTLRLRDVAEVRPAVGPVQITRANQVREVSVGADVAGGDLARAVSRLRARLDDLDRPAGYEFHFGGRAEMMAGMMRTVLAVMAFALFFSFIVLAVQFDSVKLPALILGSVPVCLVGVVYLLYLAGLPLGATVLIGGLVVVAATVNDGVLLLTFAREMQDERDLPPDEAVVEAAMIRLRPRMMTTLTTMMGFLPLALNIGEGGDMLQPMAVGAIGGLLMEMLVALYLMPCLYVLFTRGKRGSPLPT